MTARNFKDAFDPVQPNREVKAQILAMAGETGAKRDGRRLVYRIAAVAALLAVVLTAVLWPAPRDSGIVTAPGVLKVQAYEATAQEESGEPEKMELPENEKFAVAIWCPTISGGNFGLPITLEVPGDYFGEAEVQFCVSSTVEGLCEETVVENGEDFSFPKTGEFRKAMIDLWYEDATFYLDILIFADEKIVGYGVVSFCYYNHVCYAYQLSTVCYPIVDGAFQEITEEFVWKEIEKYKQEQTPGEGAKYLGELRK